MDLTGLREEYGRGGLDLPDLADDPIEMFERWMRQSVDAGLHEPNAMVVSTVSADGRPSSRTVLLKGVGPGGFVFFTNRASRKGDELGSGMAEYFENKTRPLSAGVAIPVFAFFAAGVALGGFNGLATALSSPITLGIVLGLVLGKPIGIFLTTWTLSKVTRAELDSSLRWIDVLGVAMLAGIGFTVSLLIGDLAYADAGREEYVKVGVLTGSLLSALLASVLLATRNATYRRIHVAETTDDDRDGVPDIYQPRQD